MTEMTFNGRRAFVSDQKPDLLRYLSANWQKLPKGEKKIADLFNEKRRKMRLDGK